MIFFSEFHSKFKFKPVDLVFASSNKNKIKEINALIPSSINLRGLTDIGITDEIPETGATIKDNSLIKARFVQSFLNNSSIGVFADDSGLEVASLQNRPGVFSARYAGVPKSDEANNKKLLYELEKINDRKARFITVITLIINGEVHYFEGIVNGTIARAARGDGGFGYDPLFIPQGFRSTFAELGASVKNEISHRGLAVKKLLEYLNLHYL